MGYKILVGVPSGGMISEGTARASWLVSKRWPCERVPSCMNGIANFNNLWAAALNSVRKNLGYTHFAMMHADIAVVDENEDLRWADILIEEMTNFQADFISVPMAIKDHHGILACGIGDRKTRWNPWRRFTKKEIGNLPPTFTAASIGYGDKYLIHSGALCMWDLRNPKWQEPNEDGSCKAIFNFTETIRLEGDRWVRRQDSEDWAYSRALWQMGMKTCMTSKVKMLHMDGGMAYPNWSDGAEDSEDHDDATKDNWREDRIPMLT